MSSLILVTVAETAGSTPREAGASMLVGPDSLAGSIGGGRAEHEAIAHARALIAGHRTDAEMAVTLGPASGQCCGGRMRLRFEPAAGPVPEPLRPEVRIFGAGHVGRALAAALRLLPVIPHLVDSRPAELALASSGVRQTLTPLPDTAMREAPPGSAAVVTTHDHGLDFLLVEEGLRHGALAYLGMIGSQTKRARLEAELRRRGLDGGAVVCPIGGGRAPDKRPEVIAAHAASEIMSRLAATAPAAR